MKKSFVVLLFFVLFSSSVWANKTVSSFELYTLNDKLFSLSGELKSNKSDFIIVDFFSIYCKPCKKALKTWNKIYLQNKKNKISMVLVVLPTEEDRMKELEKIDAFFSKRKMAFPIVFDKYSVVGKQFSVVDKNGSALIPQVFVLNKKGEILKQSNDVKEIMNFLSKQIK